MTTCRNLDVTPQILDHHRIYGASDNTNQSYTASSRCLNYNNGGSIQKPEQDRVSTVPNSNYYTDSVGLFGSENHFVKVNMLLQNPIRGVYIQNGYIPAKITTEVPYPADPYTHPNEGYDQPGMAFIDYDADLDDDGSCNPRNVICINTYEPAKITGDVIEGIQHKYFKVELINHKTGNKYIDAWLDVRLYNKAYDEHPYDVMYVKHNEPFYIGFHARNTKRLPYNVECVVGGLSSDSNLPPFGELGDFDNRLLATKR